MDISFDARYDGLIGFTQKEVEETLKENYVQKYIQAHNHIYPTNNDSTFITKDFDFSGKQVNVKLHYNYIRSLHSRERNGNSEGIL